MPPVLNRQALPAVFPRLAGWTALFFALLFGALAYAVTKWGEPPLFVQVERWLVNHSDYVAWVLTWGGYLNWLGPICLLLIIVAYFRPEWRARIVLSIVVLLLGWLASDSLQHLLHRPRRLDWFVKHETAFSFPSTHAALACTFYWLWATYLWKTSWALWARVACAGLVLLIAIGICWSRLALGAHYLTDILGGIALGLALCYGAAAAARRMGIPI